MVTKKPRYLVFVYPAFAILIFLAIWAYAARTGYWPAFLFPAPRTVLGAGYRLAQTEQLVPAVLATLRRLSVGFAGSILIGFAIGFFMARFRPLSMALKPYLLGLQSLPGIAWVPMAMLWFGFTEEALIFVTLIGSVFAATLMFTDAMASVPERYTQVAQTMGARGMALVGMVAIPAALPAILSAVKQTWSFAWRSLLGAEIVFATVGLGFLLNQGREFLDAAQVFAVMILTLAVGLVFEVALFSTMEKWVRRRWGIASTR